MKTIFTKINAPKQVN